MDMVESTSTLHIEYGEMETDNTHSEAGNSKSRLQCHLYDKQKLLADGSQPEIIF